MAQPVIAITGPEKGAFGPRSLVAVVVSLYGAKPLQIRPSQGGQSFHYDGVVVTGGHDIDPVFYAAEPEVEPRHDKARDALEIDIIKRSLARRLPILGICRGAQLLNVCRGGDLYQDLRQRRKHTSNRRTVLPLKTLKIGDGSLLAQCMGIAPAKINSLHNQAINSLGDGLQVSGRDLDGIVQAIEDPQYGFLLGVQWHPEFLIFMARQRALFRALIAQARHSASSRCQNGTD